MMRFVRLHVLALAPLAVSGLTVTAHADQAAGTPASSTGRQQSGDTQGAAAQANKNLQATANQDTSIPPGGVLTPAQRQYGLPRNPLTGPPPTVDISKPLTLNDLLAIALSRQNSIAIAQASADAAKARLAQAKSAYYPQVVPTFSYSNALSPIGSFNSAAAAAGGVTASPYTVTQTDLIAASWTIFDMGLREANVGANRTSLYAAEYTVGDQRQAVIFNVTQAYFNVLRDGELIRVQQENVQAAQTTLDSIKAQVQVGNAAQSDTLQAEANLANAQVTLIQAQSNYRVDQATLKNAIGVSTPNQLALSESKVPAPASEPDVTPMQQYFQTAFDNRLDIRSQQEAVYAQGYQVRLAKINAGVTATATISEGYQFDPIEGEQRQFLVNISYPLFDGGATRSIVHQNEALLDLQRRTLDQVQQTVELSVEQAYQTRETARQSVVAAQAAVRAGDVNYQAELEKQKEGLVNVLDVLNAEVQRVTAEVSLVQATYDYYIAQAQLERALGTNDPAYSVVLPQRGRPDKGQKRAAH
jgi:TolC family type I secretion outer membrane protein